MNKMLSTLIVLSIMVFSTFTFSADHKNFFFENAKKMIGEYKLINIKKNDPKCATIADLSFIGKSAEEGIRLGQSIFLGPFSAKGDISDSKDYCKITTEFSFTENSVTETTELSECTEEAKGDEAKTTKTLAFKDKTVNYTIKETDFHCSYKKIGAN